MYFKWLEGQHFVVGFKESQNIVGGYLTDAQQWRFVLGMSYGGSGEFARTVTRRPKNYSRSNICSQVVFRSVILSSVLTYKTTRWQHWHLTTIKFCEHKTLWIDLIFTWACEGYQICVVPPKWSVSQLFQFSCWSKFMSSPPQILSVAGCRFFRRNEWV